MTGRSVREAVGRAFGELLHPPLVQFGPPRTGTTLVWNALTEIFPGRVVLKRHGLSRWRIVTAGRAPIVATVRHPLDALASAVLRHGQAPPSDAAVAREAPPIVRAFDQLCALRDDPRVLVCRYERFSRDLDHLLDAIEGHFAIRIESATRLAVARRCSIERAAQIASGLGDFGAVDPGTGIHGRHVSDFRGASGYYAEVLSPAQIEAFAGRFDATLRAFGYTV